MKLSPLMSTVGTAALVGVGTTAAMAATGNETARDVRMGMNTLALPLVGATTLVGITGAVQASENGLSNVVSRWGSKPSGLTVFNRGGAAVALGLGAATGVLMANLGASVVLDIEERSLAGGRD